MVQVGISENAYLSTGVLALLPDQPPAYTEYNRKYTMSTLLPFLALDQPCDQILAWVNERSATAGFRVVETFDLQVARLAHNDCTCPHHDTERCTCQLIVLLVYQKKQENPATLVIHGQDGKTWLSLMDPVGSRKNPTLEATIKRVLQSFPKDKPAPVEVTVDARHTC